MGVGGVGERRPLGLQAETGEARSEVPQVAREWLLELADKHDLVVTGSSDYHGIHGKPNRLGENSTSVEMLERIVELSSGTAPQL